jgi:hypothetical protein
VGTYQKAPREVTPAGRELMLKLKKLKPPYSSPSYADIAKGTGLSVGTVHTILRKGEYPRGSFDSLEKILLYFNVPVAEYEQLWEEVREQQIDTQVIVTQPFDNGKQPDFLVKSEALRNAALVYQGSAFPAQQIIQMAEEFEDYLSGQRLSD